MPEPSNSTPDTPTNDPAPHGTEDAQTDQSPKDDTDWVAEARKWEKRAKENKSAADELAELKRAQMSDAEKAATALSEAEERAQRAEAALARYEIAAEFGLSKEDVEALSSISDPDALRTVAQRLADRAPSGPRPNPAQGRRGGDPAPTNNAERFAQAVGDLF